MAFDLKSATPDTSFPANGFLFGADSQAAASPSIYSHTAYLNYILSLANTWTAQNTFAAGTITTSQPLTLTQTWNAGAVTFTAIKTDVTDTSSSSASLLIDTQVGSSSKFTVRKNGQVRSHASFDGTMATLSFAEGTGVSGLGINSSGGYIYGNSTSIAAFNSGAGFIISGSLPLGFSAGASDSGATDTAFYRNAAAIMSLRGSSTTTPGAFNFYTYGASPPSAPSASMALLYADTSGGKIRIMALFPSGAAQQVAIEP